MISAWGAPGDDAAAQAYVDAGFNTVMATAERLDLCARHGLRVLVKDATPEQAAKLKADAGVWGWHVQDEPKVEDLGKVGERVALFHAADAEHPAYVNLMAWMDLEQYLGTVKPRFLSYDNRDLATDREVSLHLGAGVAGLEAFDTVAVQWQALELKRPEPQTPTTRVKLLAGGMALLRVP